MPSPCPVEILLPAFKLGIANIHATEDAYYTGQKVEEPEQDATWQAHNEAWWNVWHLADVALDVTPTSQAGLAVQLALAIDQLVILECTRQGDEDREEMCRRVRMAIRRALERMDLAPVRDAGILAFFLGERPGEPLGIARPRSSDPEVS